MLTIWLLATAFGGSCTDRLTVAPLMTPLGLPVPSGGSLRWDHALHCPTRSGSPSLALSVDLGGFVTRHVNAEGAPTLRQQVGLHVEPQAMHVSRGGPYVNARLAVLELLRGRVPVVLGVPGVIGGYRFETKGGLVVQVGIGYEIWSEEWMVALSALTPALEMRLGAVTRRPDPPAETVR